MTCTDSLRILLAKAFPKNILILSLVFSMARDGFSLSLCGAYILSLVDVLSKDPGTFQAKTTAFRLFR